MRVLMLQLDAADPPGRLGEWLRDAGAEFDLVALDAGDALPALDGYRGLVVLGGAMGANDDAQVPYLAGVKALLREAVSAEVPTLAICLGAQLLAAAHGGRVTVDPDGPEIGAQLVAKRSAAANDPLFRPLPIAPDVIQWHYDTIATLPPGAVHLAGSPVCENQAFRLGRLAWGLQFHIETTPEIVRAWASADAADLGDLDLELILRRSDAAHADVAEVWQPFTAAFADLVRDPSAVPEPAAAVDPVAAARAALAGEAQAARMPLGMPGMPPRRPPSDA